MAKKLFGGKETYSEELKEGKAIKSGKISPERYAKEEGKEESKFKCGGKVKGGTVKKAAGGPVPPQAIAALLAARQRAGGAPRRPGPTGLPLPPSGGAPGAGPTGMPMPPGAGGPPPGMKHGGKVHKKAGGGVVKKPPTGKEMGGMGMKHGGKVHKMSSGGETVGLRNESKDVEKGSKLAHGEHGEQKRGHTRGKEMGISGPTEGIEGGKKHGGKVKKYAKGGFVKSADGIAQRGKTAYKSC